MDNDIQFGELEQAPPQRELRPDQNRHYAVVPYESPEEAELAVYVDVDVLRDMELHALSNTRVELGGVLLGGQYQDSQGRPFVVVTDSLRAEHYESTKGSFKFTHDTWSEITRQREAFPDDVCMVGWYHTHPGWGVFLSSMDTFICDNFFNKPLDVALVIDPCGSDRAFFQWTGPALGELRRTGGFYLIGSRFRQAELELLATQLESGTNMPIDPRQSALQGAYPAPIIQVTEPRSSWLPIAVLGMLTLQFTLLALIAWRISAPPPPSPAPPTESRADIAAQREMLDKIIGRLDVAPEGIVESLEEQRRESEELKAANLGLLERVRTLQRTNEFTQTKLRALENRLETLREDKTARNEQLKELKKQLAAHEKSDDPREAAAGSWRQSLWQWRWYLGGGLLLAVVLALIAATYFTSEDADQPDEKESSP